MSATRQQLPEDVLGRLNRLLARDQQLWLQVEGHRLYLTPGDLPLAARVAAAYHNQICYNAAPDDGWDEETRAMERRAQEAMLSDSDTDAAAGD